MRNTRVSSGRPTSSTTSSYSRMFSSERPGAGVGAGGRSYSSSSYSSSRPVMAQRTSSSMMSSRSSPSRRVRSGAAHVTHGGVSVVDFSLSEAINADFRSTRTDEKAQMQQLNDRFVTYIDTVRTLEQQNRALAAELERLRSQQQGRSRVGDAYQEELRELRGQVERLTRDKAQAEVERDNLADDAERLRHK